MLGTFIIVLAIIGYQRYHALYVMFMVAMLDELFVSPL